MKLRIEKTEKSEIVVYMEADGKSVEFRYPEFIKRIYYGEAPAEIEFSGDIDEEQQTSLRHMIKEIVSATVTRRDTDGTGVATNGSE